MVSTTDKGGKEFVWVKRGDIWVKKYPAYLGPKVTQYTKVKQLPEKYKNYLLNMVVMFTKINMEGKFNYEYENTKNYYNRFTR